MNTEVHGSGVGGRAGDRDGLAGGGRGRLLHADITRGVIGAFYDVYNELGYGFGESVYRAALAVVLEERGVAFIREASVVARFRSRTVGVFKPDFIIGGAVIAEVKARGGIENSDRAQLLNYLRVAGLPVGLLLNFGPRAEFERLVGRAGLRD